MLYLHRAAIVLLVVAAVAAVWKLIDPAALGGGGAEPPSAGPPVAIVDALRVEASPARVDESADAPGRVRFEVEGDESVGGITIAKLYPDEDGRVSAFQGMELQILQTADGELDLAPWLRKKRPSGVWYLRFGLRVEGGTRHEVRVGWARVDPVDLTRGTLVVRPTRGETVDVSVRTSEGQGIPGALVSLDLFPLNTGVVSVPTHTSAEGNARFSGLEPGRLWSLRLPEGVGPRTDVVETNFESDAGRVEMEVSLAGSWSFLDLPILVQAPGQAAILDAWAVPGEEIPRTWPVSRHVVPGYGAEARLHVMRSGAAPWPEALELRFRGLLPQKVALTDEAAAIELPLVATQR